jgi:hypothetical protein
MLGKRIADLVGQLDELLCLLGCDSKLPVRIVRLEPGVPLRCLYLLEALKDSAMKAFIDITCIDFDEMAEAPVGLNPNGDGELWKRHSSEVRPRAQARLQDRFVLAFGVLRPSIDHKKPHRAAPPGIPASISDGPKYMRLTPASAAAASHKLHGLDVE